MKKLICLLAALGLVLPVASYSQDRPPVQKKADEKPADDDGFYPKFRTDEDIRDASPGQSLSNKGLQYGVWLTPVFINSQNSKRSDTSTVDTARVWMKSYLWDGAYVYARGKYNLTAALDRRGSNDNYMDLYNYYLMASSGLLSQLDILYKLNNQHKLRTKTVNHSVDLDVGFLSMNLGGKTAQVTIGRKYFILGSGLVLNGRGDGGEVDIYSPVVNVKALVSYTGWLVKDDNPYGMSDRDLTDGARRLFAGGEVFHDFYNQTLYFLALGQIDYGMEDRIYRTHYNSQYYGAGLKGVLFGGLVYNGEFVAERGKSYINRSVYLSNPAAPTQNGYVYISKGEKIKGYGGALNLSYYFDAALNPVILFQYSAGTGDKHRNNYKQPGGNGQGSDFGFIPFGTFVGGYALRPLIGNLHTLRGGFSISPFSWSDARWLRSMSLMTKYSFYLKNKAAAGINGGNDALKKNRFVGQGVDVSLRWLIFSDLSTFVNYAIFVPGSAYPASESNRHFTMVGFNISF